MPLRRVLPTTLLVAAFAVLGGAAPAGATVPTYEGVPAFGGPVFLIIGENTQLSQLNMGNAPYLLGTLKPASAWLTNYWATTHYSESNYAAMTSGNFTTCEQKDGKVYTCATDLSPDPPNLFDQLFNAGTSFTTWSESMPLPCSLLNTGNDANQNHYAAKHNPQLLYDNVEGNVGGVPGYVINSTQPPTGGTFCQQTNINMGGNGSEPNDTSGFEYALAHNLSTISKFNLVVPNECEDGHSNCKPEGNPILQFDDFLSREVPLIQDYINAHGGLLIVTFDEGVTSSPKRAVKFGNGGNVAFAAWGPQVSAGEDNHQYTHYSLLRTLEDGFGGLAHIGHAQDFLVNPINTIWN